MKKVQLKDPFYFVEQFVPNAAMVNQIVQVAGNYYVRTKHADIHINEGEWIVQRGNLTKVMSEEKFIKTFEEVPEETTKTLTALNFTKRCLKEIQDNKGSTHLCYLQINHQGEHNCICKLVFQDKEY